MSVTEYVVKNFPKKFKDANFTIEETESAYFVRVSRDESPLVLSKGLTNLR